MRVAIGCDHRGLKVKKAVIGLLEEMGFEHQDFGCHSEAAVDYPDIARDVAKAVAQGQYDAGVLVCGTGNGMAISANKVKGIRAAVCHDIFSARRARGHNDANILCIAGDTVNEAVARDIALTFFTSAFEGGRHARRVEKIKALEEEKL